MDSRSPLRARTSAASERTANGRPDLSQISSREFVPSERFKTQSRALTSSSGELPPVEGYKPRLPSWGSHNGARFLKVLFFSSKSKIEAQTESDSASDSGDKKSRLSAEV